MYLDEQSPFLAQRRPFLGVGRPQPSFALDFIDAGAGAVNIVPYRGGVTGTYTRATTAWTKLSSGLWAEVASGTARATYSGMNDVAGALLGYWAEGARTNSALFARDMTNAAWVKSNITATKNQMGIDGVANSATLIASTNANATILQTLTAAATSRAYAPFVRRVSGTGNVQITQDNGGSWTTVTVPSTWTRVTDLVASQLNPVFGFRLVNSGESIAVDMNQIESGAFSSSPIPTTNATVTRNADVLSYPTTGWLNAAGGTMLSVGTPLNSGTGTMVSFEISDGTANERIAIIRTSATSEQFLVVDGGVTQANPFVANAYANGSTTKAAGAYAANDVNTAAGGVLGVQDTSATLPTVTTAYIGTASFAGQEMYGTISSIAYYPVRLPNGVLQQLTN